MPPVVDYVEQDNMFCVEHFDLNLTRIFGIRRMPISRGIVWGFPCVYPDAYFSLKDFKILYPDGRATPQALEKIKYLKEVPEQVESLSILNSLGYEFRMEPYMFQLQAIEHMLHYPALAVLLEQGMGKTFVTLNYLAIQKALKGGKFKAVVFAPKIVLYNWVNETRKFTDLSIYRYHGTPKKKVRMREEILDGDYDIVVTNYEQVVPRGDSKELEFFLKHLKYDCVVVDEAHRIKGHNSKRSVAVSTLARKAEYRYMLSGTLTLGNPRDLFMPFNVLNGWIFGENYYRFENTYCEYSPNNKHVVTGYKNLDKLKAKADPYIFSRRRADCLDLPERVFTRNYYEVTPQQQLLYNAILTQKEVGGKNWAMNVELALVKLTKLRQVLSGFLILPPERNDELCNENCPELLECIRQHIYPWNKKCLKRDPENPVPKPVTRYVQLKENPKLDLLRDDLEDLAEKACVWAFYKKDIEYLKGLLDELGIGYITASDDRCDERFNAEKDLRVFIGQHTQGIGINLQTATCSIFYSHNLKLEDRLQPLDRNYRIGQKEKVLVKDYVCPGSIEESILELLERKEDVKNFLQTKVECKQCGSSMLCFTKGILPYSEKCKLVDARRHAEIVPVLSFKTLPGVCDELDIEEGDYEDF